jgi:hypothetical protein
MKKKLLLIFSAGMLTYNITPAQFTLHDFGVEVQHADISVVDVDNDNDLDVVITGQGSAGTNISKVYLNNGAGTFIETPTTFKGLTFGNMDWNDINGDGKIDMIANGFPEGQPPYAGIFTSNGTGTFTENSPAGFPQLSPGSAFADLNNDGYTDILIFGNYFDGKCKILFNDKIGGFTTSAQFEAYNWVDPVINIIDYDNDKDLDIFLCAYDDIGKSRYSKMFVNNNGTFTETNLNIIQKAFGSSIWGDYNSDGFLDLLINGDGGANGENSSDIYRLYRNVGGVFTEATTFSTYRQISTADGSRFADWDNDGDLDIIVTGYSETATTQRTAIFLNTAGVFAANPTNNLLPGVSESSIEVADLDNDSDLDLLISGYSGNNYVAGQYNRKIAISITNPAVLVNLAPTAPGGLNASGNQASLTLSWTAATDLTTPQGALSYNLFLVDQAGKWFYYPLADTISGKSKLQRLGNVNLNLGWVIKGLPAGTYRWGVQAVDNSFMGSAFAKSNFTINADGSLPVILKSFVANADGKKARIEWSTASEQNNDRFEIQRSSDGNKFFHLATVKGSGTTNTANSYAVYDNNPSAGINYYKLVQFNLDGVATNHGIKTVNFNVKAGASVLAFPNPVQGAMGLRLSNFEGKQLIVSITDMMGKLIHTETITTDNGQGDYKLHLNKPISGQYILLVSGEGLKKTLKVIVK